MTKTTFIFLLSLPFTGFVKGILEKFIISDTEFASWLIVLITVDTGLGVRASVKLGKFDWDGWKKVLDKLLLYSALLILSNVLDSYSIQGEKNVIFTWFPYVICTSLIVSEAISIMKHVREIRPGLLPKWLVKKLEDFKQQESRED